MAPRRSEEFKKKVVEEAIRERNWSQVAKKNGVCESTVRKWIKDSGRQAEAMMINPRSQMLASRRGAPLTTRVPTASRRRNPFHLVVDHGVLQFINRKRSEVGYTFTRKKLQDEALRIARENEIEGFMASIGWWNGFRSRNGISTAQELNNGAPAENEDEPLEVDPPVEDEVDPAIEIDPPVESENEDEAIEIDPPVEEGQSEPSGHSAVPEVENFHQLARASSEYLEQILNSAKPSVEVDSPVEDCQSEPGGLSAVPEVENFHQVARASSEYLEQILNFAKPSVEVDPPVEDCQSEPSGQSAVPEVENFHEVALKSSDYLEDILSLVSTYNTVWASRKEQEEGILNQPSLDYGVENTSIADQIDEVIALSPLALENISISELMGTT